MHDPDQIAPWLNAVVTGLPWVLSASTIYTMLLAGSKNRNTWLVGLFGLSLRNRGAWSREISRSGSCISEIISSGEKANDPQIPAPVPARRHPRNRIPLFRHSRKGYRQMIRTIFIGDALQLKLGNAGRAELADALREGYQRAESLIAEWLHEDYEFVRPEEIGALTDAPILCDCDGIEYPDTGDREFREDAKIFWFPDYMIRDPWAELARRGRVGFVKAGAA